MIIYFRIILGIIGGFLAIKLAKTKKYTQGIAFLIGFIFPILGNGIIYYSKDIKKVDENNEEDKELEMLIQNLSAKEENK